MRYFILSSLLLTGLLPAIVSCNGVEEGTAPPGLLEAKDKGSGNIYLKTDTLNQEEKDSLSRLKAEYAEFMKHL